MNRFPAGTAASVLGKKNTFRLLFLAAALTLLLGGASAFAETYYETDESGSNGWNVTWTDSTGGTHTGVTDPNGSYYVGGGTSTTQKGLVRAGSAFGGKTLYVGITRSGALMELGTYIDTNSTFQVNSTTVSVADLQLGNGAVALYGDSGNALSGKITVRENANALFRAWTSSTNNMQLNIKSAITGGKNATIEVYSFNPLKTTPCTINIAGAENTFEGTWSLTQKSNLLVSAVNGLGTASKVTTSGANAKLILNANQTFAGLTLTNDATLQMKHATAAINDFQLGNGTILMDPTSTANSTISGNMTVAENANATITLRPDSTSGLKLYLAGTISGGAGSTITIDTKSKTAGGDVNTRPVITSAANTFTGTWSLTAGSYLYLGDPSATNDNGLGIGSSITMAANSKVVLFASQELKDVTITGAGTTLTPSNAKWLRITGTLKTDGTLIAASNVDGKLNVLAGTSAGTGSVKTAYINSIQKFSTAGQDDFYLGYGSDKYGALYVNTIGDSAADMDLNLVHAIGSLGAYSSTGAQGIRIFGNYSHSGTAANSSLNLDVAGGQTLAVSGTISIANGLTLNATTDTAITSRKPCKVVSSTGTATGLNKIVLGTSLASYESTVFGNALYVGTHDSFHTYYLSNGTWNRFGIDGATVADTSDADGIYYMGANSGGTYHLDGKTVNQLYLGYDVNTNTMTPGFSSDGSFTTTCPTLAVSQTVNAEIFLGKGALLPQNSNQENVLRGKLHVSEGADSLIRLNSSAGERTLTINSAIDGSGTLSICGRTTAANYLKTSVLNFTNPENAFTGTLKIFNDIAVFAKAVNTLGNSKIAMNPRVLDGDASNTLQGNARLFVTADQSVDQITYNMKDAASFISVGTTTAGNAVTLSANTLKLGGNFTLSDRVNGTDTYYAGVLNAKSIESTATDDVAFNLTNGTLKTQTIGSSTNNINLTQNGGVLAYSSTDGTNRLMTIYGDYTQNGGTLQLALDSSEMLHVTGDLDLMTLTLTDENGFTPEEGTYYDVLKVDGEGNFVDLAVKFINAAGEETALGYRFVNGSLLVGNVGPNDVPEPAAWILLALGTFFLRFAKMHEMIH